MIKVRKPIFYAFLATVATSFVFYEFSVFESQKQAKTVQIEYIYKDSIREIVLDPLPPETIRTPEKVIIKTVDISSVLSKEDSVKIFRELLDAYVDYASEKDFSQTVVDDSSMYVRYFATVKKNNLDFIKFDIVNRYPYKEVRRVPYSERGIFAGVDVSSSSIEFDVAYQSKKGNIFSVGLDSRNNFTVGYKHKLVGF